jgi:hypothetical protein
VDDEFYCRDCGQPCDPDDCHADRCPERSGWLDYHQSFMGDTEEQYGGAFDGFDVTSDADPGL